MTPTFRYPTHELLFVSGSAHAIPAIRSAIPSSGPAIALTTLTRAACLGPHLQAEDCTCPDLILLDLALPETLEAIRMLKNEPALHEIPVVALVDGLTMEDCRKAYDERVNCCVERPKTRAELEDVVHRLLEYWFQVVCLPSPARRRAAGTLDW